MGAKSTTSAPPRPALPFNCRKDMSGLELVNFASNYITSARAMFDASFDGNTSDEAFGIYHLVCLAEAVIESAQEQLDNEFAQGKKGASSRGNG